MVGKEEGADFDTYKEKQDRIPRQQEERAGPKCISASLLFPQWVTEPFHFILLLVMPHQRPYAYLTSCYSHGH